MRDGFGIFDAHCHIGTALHSRPRSHPAGISTMAASLLGCGTQIFLAQAFHCNSIDSRIMSSHSARVSPPLTHPGRSGTYADQVSRPSAFDPRS